MRGGCHGSQVWVKNYDVFHGTDDLRFRIHGSSMAGYQLIAFPLAHQGQSRKEVTSVR